MRTIAISGKGGSGKTIISALIIRRLSDSGAQAILAVDADPNVILNDYLGVKLTQTVGAIREEMKTSASSLPGGMTKQQFLEYKIQASLVETPRFDLIAMGRPEGPGCYCYANTLLRDILKTLSCNYDYVVIDNEAGMEHLSRRTAQDIDHLVIISLPTFASVHTAGKINRLLEELDSRVGEKHLILNRMQGPLSPSLQKAIRVEGLTLFHTIPEDEQLLALDQTGNPISQVPADSSAVKAVDQFLLKMIKNKEDGEVK